MVPTVPITPTRPLRVAATAARAPGSITPSTGTSASKRRISRAAAALAAEGGLDGWRPRCLRAEDGRLRRPSGAPSTRRGSSASEGDTSEVHDAAGPLDDLVEVVGPGAGGEVLPPAVGQDGDDH